MKNDSIDQTVTQTQKFFNTQWQLYQKVLLQNYMGHREIYEVLHKWLISSYTMPFTMLDLGCGDAQFIAQALTETSIASYTGVDLSGVALAIAQENLAFIPNKVDLIQENLSPYLSKKTTQNSEEFDLIFTSFALHHFSLEQKDQIVDQIAKLLARSGRFLLVDTFLSPDEKRDAFLDRYLANVRQDWSLLEDQEVAMVEEHMRTSDFPETQTTWCKIAQKHGFNQWHCLYQDPLETTQILCFSRSPS